MPADNSNALLSIHEDNAAGTSGFDATASLTMTVFTSSSEGEGTEKGK